MKKMLMMAVAVILVVVISVSATFAYLTDNEAVVNTFTVGNVAITLDELKVDKMGVPEKNENEQTYRWQPTDEDPAQEYHLLPGHYYKKDPIIHIDENSEKCWVFVKVENDIAAIEGNAATIATQMSQLSWKLLDGETDTYYNSVYGWPGGDVPVFSYFEISGDVVNDTLAKYDGKSIKVTAYAVQAEGFDTAQAAWDATFGK